VWGRGELVSYCSSKGAVIGWKEYKKKWIYKNIWREQKDNQDLLLKSFLYFSETVFTLPTLTLNGILRQKTPYIQTSQRI
jgi:hypothetical protein